MEISFCKMNETTTNKNIDQMSNVEEKKEEEELNTRTFEAYHHVMCCSSSFVHSYLMHRFNVNILNEFVYSVM